MMRLPQSNASMISPNSRGRKRDRTLLYALEYETTSPKVPSASSTSSWRFAHSLSRTLPARSSRLEYQCSAKEMAFTMWRISTSSRSEEHTSELQSRPHLVCRLLLEKKKTKQ